MGPFPLHEMNEEITILIHGFNRNRIDMSFLEQGLKSSVFETFSVNLPATFGCFNDCLEAIDKQVRILLERKSSVNCVAHSMGGLVAREYFSRSPYRAKIRSLVLIATPHSGSELADIACRIPFYTKVFPLLKSAVARGGTAHLPRMKADRTGVIAGSKNDSLLGRLFLSDPSDGRVSVESVQVEDADEFLVLPYGHHEIHHRPETLALVETFLSAGSFRSVGPPAKADHTGEKLGRISLEGRIWK